MVDQDASIRRCVACEAQRLRVAPDLLCPLHLNAPALHEIVEWLVSRAADDSTLHTPEKRSLGDQDAHMIHRARRLLHAIAADKVPT